MQIGQQPNLGLGFAATSYASSKGHTTEAQVCRRSQQPTPSHVTVSRSRRIFRVNNHAHVAPSELPP
ncbi:hypothetical protein NX059_007589 [Plenodomus lindquistii]|nr:hypothetical protein NX059_007589 [Plenodomus lindquistii]